MKGVQSHMRLVAYPYLTTGILPLGQEHCPLEVWEADRQVSDLQMLQDAFCDYLLPRAFEISRWFSVNDCVKNTWFFLVEIKHVMGLFSGSLALLEGFSVHIARARLCDTDVFMCQESAELSLF